MFDQSLFAGNIDPILEKIPKRYCKFFENRVKYIYAVSISRYQILDMEKYPM